MVTTTPTVDTGARRQTEMPADLWRIAFTTATPLNPTGPCSLPPDAVSRYWDMRGQAERGELPLDADDLLSRRLNDLRG